MSSIVERLEALEEWRVRAERGLKSRREAIDRLQGHPLERTTRAEVTIADDDSPPSDVPDDLPERLDCAADYFSTPGTYSRPWKQHVATIREAVQELTLTPEPGIRISREDARAATELYDAARAWRHSQLKNAGRHMLCNDSDRLATAVEDASERTLGAKLRDDEPEPEPTNAPSPRISWVDRQTLVDWADLHDSDPSWASTAEAMAAALAVCRRLRDQPAPGPTLGELLDERIGHHIIGLGWEKIAQTYHANMGLRTSSNGDRASDVLRALLEQLPEPE